METVTESEDEENQSNLEEDSADKSSPQSDGSHGSPAARPSVINEEDEEHSEEKDDDVQEFEDITQSQNVDGENQGKKSDRIRAGVATGRRFIGKIYLDNAERMPKYTVKDWGHFSQDDMGTHEFVGHAYCDWEPDAIRAYELKKRALEMMEKMIFKPRKSSGVEKENVIDARVNPSVALASGSTTSIKNQ